MTTMRRKASYLRVVPPPQPTPAMLASYARRAVDLSGELIRLAQAITSGGSLDFDAPELRTIDRAWAAIHGWEPRRLARIDLLNDIDFCVAWRERQDYWVEHEPRARVLRERGMAYDPAWAAGQRFGRSHPEYAVLLRDDDLRTAIEIWQARGRPRRTTATPKKWVFFAGLMRRIGLGGITAAALSDDWQKWVKSNGRAADEIGTAADWQAQIDSLPK